MTVEIISVISFMEGNTPEEEHERSNTHCENVDLFRVKRCTVLLLDSPNLRGHVSICTYHMVQILVDPSSMAKVD